MTNCESSVKNWPKPDKSGTGVLCVVLWSSAIRSSAYFHPSSRLNPHYLARLDSSLSLPAALYLSTHAAYTRKDFKITPTRGKVSAGLTNVNIVRRTASRRATIRELAPRFATTRKTAVFNSAGGRISRSNPVICMHASGTFHESQAQGISVANSLLTVNARRAMHLAIRTSF